MGMALMPAGLTGRARQACAAGRCREAIELLEEAICRQPSDASSYYSLGICYSGGCRVHELTHPGIAAGYLRRALQLAGAGGGLDRAVVLDALGNTLAACRDSSRADALRSAIECHREAAGIYEATARRDDWARLEFDLGNSLCDLAEITGDDLWQEAVAHYERALEVRTRERDAMRHAAVLENLGSACRRLRRGSAAANIGKSISCYRRALRVYKPSVDPARYAATENNLGNAVLSFPTTDARAAARHAAQALRHLDAALRFRARDTGSRDYGVTQYNRAQACLRMSPPRLEAAISGLETAYAAFRACGDAYFMEMVARQLERVCSSQRQPLPHGRGS